MTAVLVVLVGAALLTVVGVGILLLAPPSVAARLLPAAPVVGVAYLVVSLHLVGMLGSSAMGIWIALAPPVAVIAVNAFRSPRRFLLLLRAWRGAVIVAVIGGAAALIALTPQIFAGTSGVVQLTPSNDAFYYVSMSDWLAGHPILDPPDIGSAPAPGHPSPAYGDVWVGLLWGLRIGQELVGGGLASLLGLTGSAAFPGLTALWIGLLPGAAWVLAAVYARGRAAAFASALVVGVLPSTLHQMVNQNADSLLGTSLVLLTIAAVGSAVRGRGRRVPLWLAAGALAAAIGTYTEYLPFLAPVLVAVVLIGHRAELGRALLRGMAIVGLALAFGPLIWFRAVNSLLVVGGVAAAPTSGTPGLRVSVERVLGALPGSAVRDLPGDPNPPAALAVLAAVIVLAGIAIGLVAMRSRGLSVGAGVALVVAFVLAVRSGDYVAGRAVDMVSPILLVVGLIGWQHLVSRFGMHPRRVVVVAIAVVLGAASAATGVQFIRGERLAAASTTNVVDADFAALREWATRASADGTGAGLATPAFFEQLWGSDAMRDLDGVSYVTLRGDLGYRGDTSMTRYWNGVRPDVVIAGPGAFIAADADAVTDVAGRFSRVDFTAGSAVIAVPASGDVQWAWSSSAPVLGGSGGTVLLLTDRPTLAGCTLEIASDVPVSVDEDGPFAEDADLDRVPLTDGAGQVQVWRADGPGPIALEGIRCAP
ncbi:hypothetical protein [Agromyces sp. LHK192]|uniref:hypothetical protein n=1 Tax=Agromyces sp. LHK192 TaxID=2498704 RepID=UPI000FDA5E7D|nr:hypothetical protein [Agromyces sp. LHK192]